MRAETKESRWSLAPTLGKKGGVMAKVKVFEYTARIEPAFSYDELKILDSVRPDLLELRDGDGEVFFKVAEGFNPYATDHGIVFDEEMKVIVQLDPLVTPQEALGKLLFRLQAVEKQIEGRAQEVVADLNSVIEIII